MESTFENFLDQHYLTEKKETLISILESYGWIDLISSRVHTLLKEKNPDYNMVTYTMIQSLNDGLRKQKDLIAKEKAEQALGEFFRDLIAYLLKTKPDFINQLPILIQKIEDLYTLNGDNFEELQRLINFKVFLHRVEKSVSHDNPRKTLYLKWNHSNCFKQFIQLLEYYSIIPENSNFHLLFEACEDRKVFLLEKNNAKKKFATVMGNLFDKEVIKSIGGNATWKFLEENIRMHESNKLIKPDYLRKTYSNTRNEFVGSDKYEKFIDEFLRDLEEKSGQSIVRN